MKNNVVDAFIQSAENYCSTIDNFDSNQDDNKLKALLKSLIDLYSKALYLPEVETEITQVPDLEVPVPKINIKQHDDYWEVFNPYHLNEPIGASLSDDILDIYKDVKKGILLYEKKEHLEAIWEWKFGFEIHWGSHAADAIRALHYVNVM
ncbi:MAG: DUF5063 domain-containing protein [Neobacillus sp.]